MKCFFLPQFPINVKSCDSFDIEIFITTWTEMDLCEAQISTQIKKEIQHYRKILKTKQLLEVF